MVTVGGKCGKCCGISLLKTSYPKTDRYYRYCRTCERQYNDITDEQRQNWAWKLIDGNWVWDVPSRKAPK